MTILTYFMLPLKNKTRYYLSSPSFNLKKYNDYIQTLICISADVLSEEAILKWYKEAHVAKGKSVFLDQMKKFVEWLQNAEEGTDSFKAICQSLCESKCVSSQILVVQGT